MMSLWERAYIISATEGGASLEIGIADGEGGLGLADVRKNAWILVKIPQIQINLTNQTSYP